MALSLAAATRNAMADAVTTRTDAGSTAAKIEVYSGTQPANADTAPSGTILVTFTLNKPSWSAASGGQITLQGTPKSANASATGTATWFRLSSTGTGAATILDGSVGTSGAQLNLNTTSITSGVPVTITGGTFTMPAT